MRAPRYTIVDDSLRKTRRRPLYRNTCLCPCGDLMCERGVRTTNLYCSLCRRGIHQVTTNERHAIESRLARQADRARSKCTRCGAAKGWSELQPGTGLCNNCSS